MPLPRFNRLAPQSQAAILAVAQEHFARDGKDAASFNQIIADAGISKTSAYHYFDGKDDLFNAVLAHAAQRILKELGPWERVSTVDALWTQVEAGAATLWRYAQDNPADRAILATVHMTEPDQWVQDLVTNADALGLLARGTDRDLITALTDSVLHALDQWALRHGQMPDVRLFLSRIWGGANATPRRGKSRAAPSASARGR